MFRCMASRKRTTTTRHNLGGVHCSDDCWDQMKVRYQKLAKTDETFAAWVRRMLLEAKP